MFVKYHPAILDHVFRCKRCKGPLLMDGCDNPDCENYYRKRIRAKMAKLKRSDRMINDLSGITMPDAAFTYQAFRCCMCPLHNLPSRLCPAGKIVTKSDLVQCRFAKAFIDDRGWKYRVLPGLGQNQFKARFQKPGKSSWHCVRQLPWVDGFDAAQADLNKYAEKKGWKIFTGPVHP